MKAWNRADERDTRPHQERFNNSPQKCSGRELGHRSLSCAPHLVLVDHLSHPDESSEIRGVDGKGGVLGNGLM